MIYTHPYARGFHLIAVKEGYWHFSLMVWKWELSYNVHGLPPAAECANRHLSAKKEP